MQSALAAPFDPLFLFGFPSTVAPLSDFDAVHGQRFPPKRLLQVHSYIACLMRSIDEIDMFLARKLLKIIAWIHHWKLHRSVTPFEVSYSG